MYNNYPFGCLVYTFKTCLEALTEGLTAFRATLTEAIKAFAKTFTEALTAILLLLRSLFSISHGEYKADFGAALYTLCLVGLVTFKENRKFF